MSTELQSEFLYPWIQYFLPVNNDEDYDIISDNISISNNTCNIPNNKHVMLDNIDNILNNTHNISDNTANICDNLDIISEEDNTEDIESFISIAIPFLFVELSYMLYIYHE